MSDQNPIPSPSTGTDQPTVKAILEAQQQGYDTGWNGRHPRECPYGPDAPVLRRAWAAGLAAARTDLREHHGLPADHGHPDSGPDANR